MPGRDTQLDGSFTPTAAETRNLCAFLTKHMAVTIYPARGRRLRDPVDGQTCVRRAGQPASQRACIDRVIACQPQLKATLVLKSDTRKAACLTGGELVADHMDVTRQDAQTAPPSGAN